MILVTGATGEFGRKAIDFLLNNGVNPSEISALVRNENKAVDLKEKGIEIRIGNYNDYNALIKEFNGVDKLLFISGSEIETREIQHKNIVTAAKEADVRHLVYTSFIRNTEVKNSAIDFLQNTHLKTENWIKESGIPYTILQNALYLDLLPMFVGDVIQNEVIVQPAKNGKSSAVLRSELAEVAANVLTTEGHKNKVYPLTNPVTNTYEDVAKYISEVTGKKVTYQSPTPDEFKTTLKESGVPDEYIGIFAAFSVAQANGELELQNNSLENLLGRKPTTYKELISQIYK
ncbi:SDR family oxidoreductase [Thalassobellus suaedae]|uniref:SDR family oxidoreductase n=1 Tax=Thalassobellus suaedae TaxID=3074124 RepID=A0ABY9Y598_9FLAO|nr:SDR family oxidoreductase [Flavobacteriaceae bacterium HL-DH10]